MKTIQAILAILLCIGCYTANSQPAKDTSGPSIKNVNNGIGFTIVGCTGDKAAQRVTVFFKFTNPDKPNQKIIIADPVLNLYPVAMDEDGNSFTCSKITLGNQIGATPQAIWKMSTGTELPTGLALKGSVTFKNILPALHKLAFAKIYIKSANSDGGGVVTGNIEVRNIPISWK